MAIFPLLNEKQMRNWLGVEHQPVLFGKNRGSNKNTEGTNGSNDVNKQPELDFIYYGVLEAGINIRCLFFCLLPANSYSLRTTFG